MRATSMPRTSRTVIDETTSSRASFSCTGLRRISLSCTGVSCKRFCPGSGRIELRRIEFAQHVQLLSARRLQALEVLVIGEPEAGVVLHLFPADAGSESKHFHLAAFCLEPHDGEIGYDAPHPALRQATFCARAPAGNPSRRGDKVDLFHEAALLVLHGYDHVGERRDIVAAAAARQP